MIASTQITNYEVFKFIVVLVSKLLSHKVFFIYRKDNRNCKKTDTFDTCKQSFISAFSIYITVPISLI